MTDHFVETNSGFQRPDKPLTHVSSDLLVSNELVTSSVFPGQYCRIGVVELELLLLCFDNVINEKTVKYGKSFLRETSFANERPSRITQPQPKQPRWKDLTTCFVHH